MNAAASEPSRTLVTPEGEVSRASGTFMVTVQSRALAACELRNGLGNRVTARRDGHRPAPLHAGRPATSW